MPPGHSAYGRGVTQNLELGTERNGTEDHCTRFVGYGALDAERGSDSNRGIGPATRGFKVIETSELRTSSSAAWRPQSSED